MCAEVRPCVGYIALSFSLLEEGNLLRVGYIALGLVEEDLQMNLGLALQMQVDKLWW